MTIGATPNFTLPLTATERSPAWLLPAFVFCTLPGENLSRHARVVMPLRSENWRTDPLPVAATSEDDRGVHRSAKKEQRDQAAHPAGKFLQLNAREKH